MDSLSIALTVVLIGLGLIFWRHTRNHLRLPKMHRANCDNLLTGSHARYFGNGIQSLNLVREESQAQRYKPWLIPGGLFNPDYVVLPSFQAASLILRHNTGKGGAPSALYYPGTPKTIVSLDGREWERRRKVLNPAFQLGNIKPAVSIIDTAAQELVEAVNNELQNGKKQIDMYTMCSRAVLDVIGHVAFGGSFDATKDASNRCHFAAHKLSLLSLKNFQNPFRRWLRIGKTEYDQTLKILDDAAKEQLAAHADQETLVSLIHKASDENGKIWARNEDYLEEMRLVVNASHDPALPLSLALYELCQNTAEAEKAVLEVDKFFAHHPADQPLNFEDLSEFSFVTAIFRETLRLWPVSGVGSVRKLAEPIELEGMLLPAGTMTVSPFYTIMRSENEFHDPITFKPDRFLTTENSDAIAKSLLVFSAGPRNCAGFQIALWEGTIILARLLQNFSFSATNALEMECGIHIMPKEVMLNVVSRQLTN